MFFVEVYCPDRNIDLEWKLIGLKALGWGRRHPLDVLIVT